MEHSPQNSGNLQDKALVDFVLPHQVFGAVEVRRLHRELETIDDYLHQTSLRTGGSRQETLPRASRLLELVAAENRANLLQKEDRARLLDRLNETLQNAPTIHISFASDPSASFLEKVVAWLRNNVHPLVLVRLGLQPSIAAGCVVRTPNRSFDFSLRHRFAEQRQFLLYSLTHSTPEPVAELPALPPVDTAKGVAHE